jgi:hypothetical protein
MRIKLSYPATTHTVVLYGGPAVIQVAELRPYLFDLHGTIHSGRQRQRWWSTSSHHRANAASISLKRKSQPFLTQPFHTLLAHRQANTGLSAKSAQGGSAGTLTGQRIQGLASMTRRRTDE